MKSKRIVIDSDETLFHLNDDQCMELLELAGHSYFKKREDFEKSLSGLNEEEIAEERAIYHNGNQLLQNVRLFLGVYPDLVRHLDNAPTPMDVSNKFQNLMDKAQDLCSELLVEDPYFSAELKAKGFDASSLIEKLTDLISCSDHVIKENQGESRGAKELRARKVIIDHLAESFDRLNAVSSDQAKLDFIKAALAYANISYPENIKRAFYRPNDRVIIIKSKQ